MRNYLPELNLSRGGGCIRFPSFVSYASNRGWNDSLLRSQPLLSEHIQHWTKSRAVFFRGRWPIGLVAVRRERKHEAHMQRRRHYNNPWDLPNHFNLRNERRNARKPPKSVRRKPARATTWFSTNSEHPICIWWCGVFVRLYVCIRCTSAVNSMDFGSRGTWGIWKSNPVPPRALQTLGITWSTMPVSYLAASASASYEEASFCVLNTVVYGIGNWTSRVTLPLLRKLDGNSLTLD